MGVLLASVHELVLGDLCEEEPKEDHRDNPLVESLGDLVPHLVVEAMDLLQTLQVVFLGGSIRQSPNSKVVHVGHRGPCVLEGHVLLLEMQIVVFVLADVIAESGGISEVGEA